MELSPEGWVLHRASLENAPFRSLLATILGTLPLPLTLGVAIRLWAPEPVRPIGYALLAVALFVTLKRSPVLAGTQGGAALLAGTLFVLLFAAATNAAWVHPHFWLAAQGDDRHREWSEACHSGAFIQPLANDGTIILTAAAKANTSFGCDDHADLTYFGQALMRDALPRADSLESAFEQAKRIVAERERREALGASDPQAYYGNAIRAYWEQVEAARPGARGRAGQPIDSP